MRAELQAEKIKQETEAIRPRAQVESEKIKQEMETIIMKLEEKRLACWENDYTVNLSGLISWIN